MNVVQLDQIGGPEKLKFIEKDDLKPLAGQVLVKTEAVGVNYVDVHQRKGIYTLPLPYIPGLEGAGRITEIGRGVARLRVGQRVAWVNVLGSYATQLLVPENQAIPIPDSFTIDQALLFQAMTAEYLVKEYRTVRSGDTVLVHAGAGGVGQFLVQWLNPFASVQASTGIQSAM